MSREFQTAAAHELLDGAFQRRQSCQCHVLPVLQRGHVTRRKVEVLSDDGGALPGDRQKVTIRPTRATRGARIPNTRFAFEAF